MSRFLIATAVLCVSCTWSYAEQAAIEYLCERGCSIGYDSENRPNSVILFENSNPMDRDLARLTELGNITTLAVGYQALTAYEVKTLPRLASVTRLHLEPCRDIGGVFVERLGVLFPGVENLSLHCRDLSGRHLAALGKLKTLKRLFLIQPSDVTHDALKSVATLPALEDFGLTTQVRVSAEALQAIADMKNLRRLSLSFASLGDEHLKTVGQMVTLEKLDIGDFFSAVATAKGAAHLASMPKLHTLSFRTSWSNESALESLAKIQSLRHLTVSLGPVDGQKFLEHIAAFKNLESLDVSEGVSDEGISVYLKLPKIQTLGFGRSSITEQGIRRCFESGRIKHLSVTTYRIPVEHLPALRAQYPGLSIRPSPELIDQRKDRS